MGKKKYFYAISVLILTVIFNRSKLNNTCNTYSGYFNIFFSRDCFFSPDLDDDIFEIIRRYIGVSETHQVETEDGYILGLFRIPRENSKGVILLDNPISHDATIWVSQYNKSIAFLFWREGYDVWMSNSRGTFYSRRHKTLTLEDPAFWNYSFHEMGYYENHAVIEYIRKKTNVSKIINFWYSLGATKSLVYASTRPKDAKNSLKIIIAIAPITHLKKATSNLKYVLPNFWRLQNLFEFDAHTSLFYHDSWLLKLIQITFRLSPFKQSLALITAVFCGWTPYEFDPSLANMFVEKVGFEASLKLHKHSIQTYTSGEYFRLYDYGEQKNLLLYGHRKPPLYPFDEIRVPVLLIYGEKDSFSYFEDNELIYGNFSKKVRSFGRMKVRGFNHLDFFFGKRRNGVYKNVIQVLRRL